MLAWAAVRASKYWQHQFVRYRLMRLGLGDDLQSIQCGGYNHPIASVEEVLAL